MKYFLTAALAALAICAQAQVLTTAPKQSYSGITGGADTTVLPQRNWIEAESACFRGLPSVYKTLPYEVKPTTAQSKNLFFAPYETIHQGKEISPHPCEWVHNTAFDDGVPLRQYRIFRVCLRYESRSVRVTSEGGEFWELVKKLNLGQK